MTPRPPLPYDSMRQVPSFELLSDDVADGVPMAPAQVCDGMGGENISPSLRWSGFPPRTEGFAVTCLDPDTLSGSGFWHWMLLGLPASVTSLPAGAGAAAGPGLPSGAFHVRNDDGTKDYRGACPPAGEAPHRYVFAVHALDAGRLDWTDEFPPALAGFLMYSHVIARALLTPVYGR